MKVVLLQEAKASLIALEYDDLVYSFLTQENKQELLTAKRKIVSRKITKEKPFTGQLVGTKFQDHYIKANYRIFKGRQEDCVNFMRFYLGKDGFMPEQLIYINKYSNVVRLKSVEDFLRIV